MHVQLVRAHEPLRDSQGSFRLAPRRSIPSGRVPSSGAITPRERKVEATRNRISGGNGWSGAPVDAARRAGQLSVRILEMRSVDASGVRLSTKSRFMTSVYRSTCSIFST